MKSNIQHYLAAKTDRSHRYHVVRSSISQCRRVPFGKWTARIEDELDVLLDFSATKPVEIYLKSRFDKNLENSKRLHPMMDVKDYLGQHARLGWYFLDNRSKKTPCCSGYEALFVAYLKWNNLPFEYQKWVISHGSTMGTWARSWFNDNYRPNTFTYVPDFYLPVTDELVELKGWQSPGRTQAKAIPYLKRKGYRIRLLEWEHLRRLLGISVSYDTCLNRAKKDFSLPSRAFADPRWVKERLSEA